MSYIETLKLKGVNIETITVPVSVFVIKNQLWVGPEPI